MILARRLLLRRRWRTATAGLGVLSVLGALGIVRPRRLRVEGHSMEPTLSPGDRLLVVRPGRLRSGDLVALRDPRDGRLLVKRVGALGPDGITVRGDNPAASTDSATFGPVPGHAVVGKVLRRYAPAWRAGPVR